MTAPGPENVLIVGGGVAALEAMLALRARAGEAPHITLLAPDREFVLRASAVLEPFARGTTRRVPLTEITAHHGVHLVSDALAEVRPDEHVVVTRSGTEHAYGTLLIALGTVPEDPFPGAITFAGFGQREAIEEVLAEAVAGKIQSIAFVIPPGTSWPLPLYELAMLTEAHLREHGAPPVRLVVVTPEERPLAIFGEAASEDLEARLEDCAIELHTLTRPRDHADGVLHLAGGSSLHADRAIAFPRLHGPRIAGLPHDDDGYIRVDDHQRVVGVPDVYAAGDCTAFPLKQGGIASQQADAAAASIALALGASSEAAPFEPVLRGLLLTGDEPSYFRAYPGTERPPSTVAINAPSLRQEHAPNVAAHRPLWWPPSKVAGHYLGAFLAHEHEPGGEPGHLEDREVPDQPEGAAAREERRAALDLALLMAEGEAGVGDYRAALRALDAAEALAGALPEEYVQKRELWDNELHGRPGSRYAGG
ncbi:MAG: NAD(P)/FAD-dependent oxidoreductase [Solirubrobacteraceae bacterium]|nr:NAD(P)/FAD-dependent oxidoreductase [Solirubrobacteraceae bacterium]